MKQEAAVVIRSKDHPEANGRRPVVGDQEFTLTFPMEDGQDLRVLVGKESMNRFSGMLAQMMVDDAMGNILSTPMPQDLEPELQHPAAIDRRTCKRLSEEITAEIMEVFQVQFYRRDQRHNSVWDTIQILIEQKLLKAV